MYVYIYTYTFFFFGKKIHEKGRSVAFSVSTYWPGLSQEF